MPNDGIKGDLEKSLATALIKIQMLKFDKLISIFWPAYLSLFKDKEKLDYLESSLAEFE